ncbi:hypothetical protein DFJ58DRAFT_655346 [Suillus subalutaceus]|uniref:uncharacterized protein n=1 Tax=Suillus subalutaceus TaxID=48586 RepID=UPI001B87E3C5|nr:uncharacterized protein DFJ58DRAFT_655346 [Suillus subalutaceus]KAG1865541.1 hypothetical protein DFJ58DRAFT_655346 [Suillus subalutaceus]
MSNNDFFTSVPFSGQQGRTHSTDQENVVSFAHAIAARFGSADLLTARILPDEQPPSQNIILPPKPVLPPPSKPVSSSSSSSTFVPVNPSDLAAYLADPSILILDIRPHAAHTAARIHRALSLSIPSTLIKRPLFGLSKLVQMLPSSSARARFAAWPTVNHILVYDADSALVPDTSNIAGLLRKFRAEGFTGELAWVKGGFQAVWRDARHCATTDHPSPDEDDPEGSASSGALRPKHLPKAAFSLSTTTAANAASGTPAVANAANPFFDTIRQNLELSQGITERIPLRLPRRVRRRIKDLPFRWLQDIAGRSALRPSHSSFPGETSVESGSESSDDPHESDPDSNDPDVEEGAETLAMQFYRIELAEQRRLRSVMEHHARESETLPSTPVQGAFPFSITAGVEKGAKNRYNHIWPFEHARVRLHDGHRPRDPSPADDYVNASYVQPLGTRKRYIATQGPLPATFIDFWTLVWEQNVHVIVMLTREIENAMVKCGTYWVESSYGPLQLQLLNTSPPISPSTSCNTSADIGFFMSPRDKGSKQPSMIVRTFALSHRGYPGVPPRKVTHLQYLDWPDMNVPDDPRGVLKLVKCVERAVQESTPDASARRKLGRKGWRHPELDPKTGIAAFALGCSPPVLLHCSAGVGRTGGFIAVDAALDAIRRELKQRRESRARAQARARSGGMDVDVNQVKEKEKPKENIVGTVPLVIGDRKKARRHHPQKGAAKEGETSSSESLVVHVPFAEETADLDTRWQNTSSSTREWAEQVLDQTHPGEEEQETNGSGIGVDVKAGSGRSGSGSGSGRSGASSVSGSGSGGAFPPSSSVSISISHSASQSNSCPDSISTSNSGSGTNTSNSGFWGSTGADSGLVGFMRARLRDSSVTSLSNTGSDSSNEKLSRSVCQPSADTDKEDAMDVDRPPRSSSAPLQPAKSGVTQVSSELDQRTAGHAVIDYKLPRQLHQDLSPAPLMAHTNPIWTIVQDMREQRMSLCQSLRQYVFVHAAVIEGALMMVDEERELWGECTGSEGSPESVRVSASGSQMHHTSSSPSKWKRAPSPTELLREDKSGIVSFAKRPSIKRRTLSDEKVLAVFELAAGAPQVLPGGTDGVSKAESGNTTCLGMGPMAPEWTGPSVTAN